VKGVGCFVDCPTRADGTWDMASGSIAGSSATSGGEGWSGDIERATC
jgi:hypothetical protein